MDRLAKPAISAYTWAPRRSACPYSSRTSTALPSPSTKPLRVRSKGREAVSGSSLRGDVARMASKDARVIGVTGASEAPATITSALPSRMSSAAWPSESRPEVQPVETTATGPCAPTSRATSAAMELGTR